MNELSSSQRILFALKEAREKLEAVEKEKNERVAIVGIAGRFPGANNIERFWQNLGNGVNSIQFLSNEELLSLGVEPEQINAPKYVRAYSSFEDIEFFDASFFGYSPREAEIIDPQHRVFLECAWEALENAGYDPEQYQGSIGIYAGAALNSYIINLYANEKLKESVDNVQVVISNVMGLMPTRVSYKLNLTGPSCGVQTGCSTSLVSVHLACQGLLNQDCDMALAGGITINASGKTGYLYKEDGIASPDGYCRAFDANARGTVFGNGVGIVVLKRLTDALVDGDCIYAVIKGSAINNDGSQKVGLTAPSVIGQAEVIEAALAKAGIEPETIGYIETHGTGTALGDPIEIAALHKVFHKKTDKKKFCAIASVKTNIGHLDAAAGVAGLIKTVLALKHQKIPPSLNFEHPNPQIDFDNSPFYVNTQLLDWHRNGTPRRAGVSSFGMGGTNAHIILEEAPEIEKSSKSRPWQLLLLSAKTSSALEKATTNLLAHLKQNPELNLADVAYTLQTGRRSHPHRRAFVCKDVAEAIEFLDSDSQKYTQLQKPSQCAITFMFSGQGSQYVNMGWELYKTEPVFREEVDRCCDLLQSYLDVDLREVLYPKGNPLPRPLSPVWERGRGRGVRDTYNINGFPNTSLEQTVYAQPALFVIEYALAQLWMSWGIHPEAAIGHSIGEYVAATLSSVFSLEDALKLVAKRGQLMQQCPPGAMLSVALSAEKANLLLGSSLALAASNAPNMCVVSGTTAAIDDLAKKLIEQGVACRRLQTSHAFHSSMMESILNQFQEEVSQVTLNAPKLPFISNVTGTWITAAEATDPYYWVKHIRDTVRFSEGIGILQKPGQILLEVGPGRTLSTFAKQHHAEVEVLTSLPHPKDQQSGLAFILNTLGRFWLAGGEIDWAGFYANERRHRVPLPTYPFERQRYWIELQKESDKLPKQASQPQKKPDITDWFYLPSWKRSTLIDSLPAQKLASQSKCWLVFVDEWGLGLEIIQRLERENQKAIAVQVGDRFSKVSDGVYTINPQNPNDYQTLLQALHKLDKTPQAIVHLWSINSSNDSTLRFEDYQNLGFHSLLSIARAIENLRFNISLPITVITDSTQEVVGTETTTPAKATVLGAGKVIPQEYPYIACHTIDIVVPESKLFNQLTEQIIAELTTSAHDSVVAYRASYRWVQTFEPLPIPPNAEITHLRQGGVYLIAGDLVEGFGLIYAKYLAQDFHAKLVLIGRQGIPEKTKWEQWLATHAQRDAVSSCIRKLQALEASGTEFLLYSADLADETTLQSVITQAYERFGQINGAIHTGSMGDRSSCLIQNITPEECDRQFRLKVQGLLTLEKVLRGKNLDFFLLQSSLSSVVGGVGFAAYTAANLFMDAFANQQNQSESIPWISINWDAAQLEEASEQKTGAALIDLAMTPREVWEVNKRILSGRFLPQKSAGESSGSVPTQAQIVVSPIDLLARIDQWIKPKSLEEKESNLVSNHSRLNVKTDYVAPRNPIEQTVANVMQDLLGIERIGIDDNFFELGGHSLLAIQAVSRLREEFQVELPMREFLFESPTVAGIAKTIEDNQSADDIAEVLAAVENLSSEEVQALLESDRADK